MQKINWQEGLRSCKTPQVLRENFRQQLLTRPVKRKVESEERKKKVKISQVCINDHDGQGFMVKVYPDWFPADEICEIEEDCETPQDVIEEAQTYLWNQVVEAILNVNISCWN